MVEYATRTRRVRAAGAVETLVGGSLGFPPLSLVRVIVAVVSGSFEILTISIAAALWLGTLVWIGLGLRARNSGARIATTPRVEEPSFRGPVIVGGILGAVSFGWIAIQCSRGHVVSESRRSDDRGQHCRRDERAARTPRSSNASHT